MFEPQDLPGRYGRAVRAIDHLLEAMGCEAVLAGDWAVWRHGYSARVTQDIDIVLPADCVEEISHRLCFRFRDSGAARRTLAQGTA